MVDGCVRLEREMEVVVVDGRLAKPVERATSSGTDDQSGESPIKASQGTTTELVKKCEELQYDPFYHDKLHRLILLRRVFNHSEAFGRALPSPGSGRRHDADKRAKLSLQPPFHCINDHHPLSSLLCQSQAVHFAACKHAGCPVNQSCR